MMTTPTASIPTNSRPMPVSSGRLVVRWTRLMPPTITTALTIAPSVRSKPQMAASAMPGSTPWASASPKNARPRTTTHVPISAVVVAASSPPSSARWVRSDENASSTSRSRQRLGDALGVRAQHADVRVGAAARLAEALGVELDDLRRRRRPRRRARRRASSAASSRRRSPARPASRMTVGERLQVGRPTRWRSSSATGSRRRSPRGRSGRRSSRAPRGS